MRNYPGSFFETTLHPSTGQKYSRALGRIGKLSWIIRTRGPGAAVTTSTMWQWKFLTPGEAAELRGIAANLAAGGHAVEGDEVTDAVELCERVQSLG